MHESTMSYLMLSLRRLWAFLCMSKSSSIPPLARKSFYSLEIFLTVEMGMLLNPAISELVLPARIPDTMAPLWATATLPFILRQLTHIFF